MIPESYGDMLIEGPGDQRRQLRCLFLYDRPLIFMLPHQGRDRIFTCCEDTETGSVYFGASPEAGMVDRVCENREPLIRAYQTGPFFRMVWDNASPYPNLIESIPEFPSSMLPDPDVFLRNEPTEDPSP